MKCWTILQENKVLRSSLVSGESEAVEIYP